MMIQIKINEDIEFELKKESKLRKTTPSDLASKILKEWLSKKDDESYHPSLKAKSKN